MINDVTLGQFIPGKSFLHKLDPRTKIGVIMGFIVLVFLANTYLSCLVFMLSMMLLVLLSGVPFKLYFKSMKVILFIILFTSFMNLFYGPGEPIYSLGLLRITKEGIQNTTIVTVRLISLIMVSSTLTFTTSPNDLTYAIEYIMSPLKYLKVDVHALAMMMTIALRFVPTLMEEAGKIMNAQKARGADIESGSLIDRSKALVPVIVPLFVSAFRRAYDLAIAMECRCYKLGEGRTRMKVLRYSYRDAIALVGMVILCVCVVLCP